MQNNHSSDPLEKFPKIKMQPCQHCDASFLQIQSNINELHQSVFTEFSAQFELKLITCLDCS